MKYPQTAQRTSQLLEATGWDAATMRRQVNQFLARPKSYTTFYYYRDGEIRPDLEMLDKLRDRVPPDNPLAGWVRDLLAAEYGQGVEA